MGILEKIRNDAKKAGGNRGKIFYLKEGDKARIRFLADLDEGIEVVFHDSFERGVNVPCQETFGRDCSFCEDDTLRTRSMYAWPVYDYEAKDVKLFLYAVNNCSPLPALMALYETYGTLTDRDYVLSVSGKQQNKSFSVIPMDKNKFRNAKVKALSESKMLEIIDKAYPATDSMDEEEEEKPKHNHLPKTSKKPTKSEDDGEDWEDEDGDDEVDYSDMSAKELYKLCKDREIDVVPKKSQKYYINQLEEYDKAQDDWNDSDDEEDEWEDE